MGMMGGMKNATTKLLPVRVHVEFDEKLFRARVYLAEDERHRRRVAFVESLANEGVIDCPAYDGWIGALRDRGWLDERPVLEPISRSNRLCHGRWKLNDKGRAEWAAMKIAAANIAAGSLDPVRLATDIVASALGM